MSASLSNRTYVGGHDTAREGRGVPSAARGRAVRHPQSVGRRVGEGARGARVQGARRHQLRLRVHARPRRRRREPGRGRRARADARRPRPTSRSPWTSRTATGRRPDDAARAIAAAAEAGAVGGSIEDWDPDSGLYPARGTRPSGSPPRSRPHDGLGFPFTLTARAENHVRGNPDFDDTITRLRAYEEAGADVLYAPRPARRSTRSAASVRGRLPAGQRARPPGPVDARDRRRRRAARERRRRSSRGSPSGPWPPPPSRSATPEISRRSWAPEPIEEWLEPR